MKDCLVTADYTGRMIGCLRVKNSDQDDHVCFCDSNNCNKDYCDPSHCDCPYADPDTCFDPVDPSGKILKIFTVNSSFKHTMVLTQCWAKIRKKVQSQIG